MGTGARRWLRGVLWGAGLVLILAVALSVLLLGEASRFSGPLLRWAAARSGRELRVGTLETHLLSRTPRITAHEVIVGNPPWSPPGTLARIGTLTAVFEWPHLHRRLVLRRLDLRDVTLHLVRDAAGHANWHWHAPGILPGRGPPLIHSLSMPMAQVQLEDARRHLQFSGTLSAGDASAPGSPSWLRIEASGQLNGHPMALAINGEPLAGARSGRAYRFAFAERSSGSLLSGRGTLLQPFDMRQLDASYRASGEDLRDLYYLVGLHLPNTGSYRLSGDMQRRGMHFDFSSLRVSSGESDVSAHIVVDWLGDHSRVNVQLSSQRLRLSDLGARAAERDAPAGAPLPATPLPLAGLRRSDSLWSFQARELQAGPLVLRSVAGRLRIDAGLLVAPQFSAALAGGHLEGEGRLDARQKVAQVSLELRARDDSVGLLLPLRKPGPPPLDGSAQARLVVSARGDSVRALAADAQGTLTVVMPHGEMRESLAELVGLDLARALGLAITHDHRDVGVRCGVATLKATNGIAHVQNLLIDTEPVLISGEGAIELQTGALDLTLHGSPKELRLLHVRAPVVVRGTVRHPKISLGKGAVLKVIDRAHAENVDCAALLERASRRGSPAD